MELFLAALLTLGKRKRRVDPCIFSNPTFVPIIEEECMPAGAAAACKLSESQKWLKGGTESLPFLPIPVTVRMHLLS